MGSKSILDKVKEKMKRNEDDRSALNDDHYHKRLVKSLMDNGVSFEVARICLGEICEDVQAIHCQAYRRGYENGYSAAKERYC